MKKLFILYIAAASIVYAACSNTHHTITSNTSIRPVQDTAMGGDAMKKDSTRP